MNESASLTKPSLPQILYALALALIPFLESIVADLERQGRPIPPSLRRLAATARAIRALAERFGMQPSAPATPAAPRPRPFAHTPVLRQAPRARPHRATPRPTITRARPHRATPQLLRTARL